MMTERVAGLILPSLACVAVLVAPAQGEQVAMGPPSSTEDVPPQEVQGERSAATPQTGTALVSSATLQAEINQALKEGRLGSVTAHVEKNFEVTLRGSVNSAAEKQRAFLIARAFREVERVKDQVFVVEE